MPPLGERICGIFFVNGFCVLCICRLPAPLLVRREPGNGLEPHPLCEAVSILTACRGCLLPCVIECSDRTALLISVPKFADFAMINTFCFPVRPLPPASCGPCRLGSISLRPLRAWPLVNGFVLNPVVCRCWKCAENPKHKSRVACKTSISEYVFRARICVLVSKRVAQIAWNFMFSANP